MYNGTWIFCRKNINSDNSFASFFSYWTDIQLETSLCTTVHGFSAGKTSIPTILLLAFSAIGQIYNWKPRCVQRYMDFLQEKHLICCSCSLFEIVTHLFRICYAFVTHLFFKEVCFLQQLSLVCYLVLRDHYRTIVKMTILMQKHQLV